jgi:hypothetical protein
MDVCMRSFCVFVVLCVDIDLATSSSPSYRLKERPRSNEKDYRAKEKQNKQIMVSENKVLRVITVGPKKEEVNEDGGMWIIVSLMICTFHHLLK